MILRSIGPSPIENFNRKRGIKPPARRTTKIKIEKL